MKKNTIILCSIIFSSLLLFSCNNKEEEKKPQNTFTVSGNLKGLETNFMFTSYKDASGNRVSDSVFVKNESFSYTAKITKPTHIIFWPNVESTIKRSGNGGYYPAKSSQFSFIANPGDNIVFNGEVTDFINAYPSGSEANNDLARINSQIFPLLNESVNTLLEKDKLAKNDTLNIQKLDNAIKKLDDEVIRLKIDFIRTNQNSEAAIWYLSDMMMRKQITNNKAVEIFKSIDDDLSENPFFKQIASRVKGIETTTIGKIVPDFSTNNTLDNTEFKFSSLQGKYVLIDFWGTWCGPCVAEMPKLKEYQEKYSDKLVVLGINSGDSKEQIEKFITPKNYNWKQLLAGTDDDNLVLKFNVSGFPTKFIIDPTGKILHRFVGDGEGSFAELDKLLN